MKPTISTITSLLSVILLAFLLAAPAAAQNNLQLSTSTLSFTAQVGGAAQQQYVAVSVSAGIPTTYTAVAQTLSGGDWLQVAPPSGQLPVVLTVTANPGLLPAGGPYTGTVTITAPGTGNSPQTVAVSLTIGSASPLSATPASLSFQYATGGAIPSAQIVTVTSPSPVVFSAVAITSSGGSWLAVNPSSSQTPNATIFVSVNPTTLTAGTYSGTITLTPTVGTPLQVGVTLTVSGPPQLNASQTSLTFNYQIGGSPPAQQTVSITSTVSGLPFTTTPLASSGGAWLVASPSSGATPSNLTISIDSQILAALPQGQFTGEVRVSAQGASNSPLRILVTLNVSVNPFLNVNPGSLSFTIQPGGALPAAQTLALTSTGAPLSFTAAVSSTSGIVSWLGVSPASGLTPFQLQVSILGAAQLLPPGTYNASVTISSQAGNPTVSVPVTLTVSDTPVVVASPSSVNFVYQIGRAIPAIQTVSLTSTGVATSFTVSFATTDGATWLTAVATALTTPAILNVQVNPVGLVKGNYTGAVTITPTAQGAVTRTIPVTLVVSDTALLTASPGFLNLSFPQGTTSTQTQIIALTSTGDNLQFTASSTIPAGTPAWLALTPLSGSTPTNLNVIILPQSLPVGSYEATISVAASGANTVTIPVRLNVTTGVAISVSPTSLSFTQAAGGPAPPTQTLSVSTSGTTPLNFSAAVSTLSGGNWLSVTPVTGTTGTTSATVTVQANGSTLPQGTYNGSVTIVAPGAGNSPVNVPVTLTVGPAQTLTLSPATINFNYQIGSAVPTAQTIQVTSSGGSLDFTAAAQTASGGNWLSVSPQSGNSPASLSVSVNPSGLTAGTYTGTIRVTSTRAGNSPQTANVNLVIAALPAPALTVVRNAASYASGPLAPGEIVFLEATNLGTGDLVVAAPNAEGFFPTVLAETRVLFDGIPGPMIYVVGVRGQLSAIVPYAIAGRPRVRVQVEYKGTLSTAVEYNVDVTAPGIFTQNAQGFGPGSVLQFQDGQFTVNSPQNPARKNAVLVIYATGEGQTSPAGTDGKVAGALPLPKPLETPVVTVGGRTLTPEYFGAAPSLVAGVFQINVRLTDEVPSGSAVPIAFTIGGKTSQPNVTVSIQ